MHYHAFAIQLRPFFCEKAYAIRSIATWLCEQNLFSTPDGKLGIRVLCESIRKVGIGTPLPSPPRPTRLHPLSLEQCCSFICSDAYRGGGGVAEFKKLIGVGAVVAPPPIPGGALPPVPAPFNGRLLAFACIFLTNLWDVVCGVCRQERRSLRLFVCAFQHESAMGG